ncbi:divalent-cation tolerance protein CutA [Candidatus Magnetobacterium casense]|uniref:Divalent-cation tolerance protein CutA n=1 Tax=Candidatus Magnetobacterium casense TaxID=1455061 RepID=A0ABS6RV90_9BACT|nr:divalent-cation tolerance protein CutA [Candidatus Magnetobacterium casensis]MBV6340550.1 divalent-cation tolerance protein CutA [Candidatus Magnetobacterium casensis]
MEFYVVLITAPDEQSAREMAMRLVEEGLAKCVNIINNVTSIFSWEGKIETSPEVLMIAKTRRDKFQSLKERVIGLHSYSVAEVIALPIVEGSEAYLSWLRS